MALEKMKHKIFFLLYVVLCASLHAQPFSINGKLLSAESGEPVIYAYCINRQTNEWAISDEQGFFNLVSSIGSVELAFSHVGYKPFETMLVLDADTNMVVYLEQLELDEVVVYPEVPLHKQTLLGKTHISPLKIKSLPTFLGEADVIKAITYLPGEKAHQAYLSGEGGGKTTWFCSTARQFTTTTTCSAFCPS